MIRRFIRKLRDNGVKKTIYNGEVREFGAQFVGAVPKMYESFFYYWERERIAAAFVIYSLLFTGVLAWMALYVESFDLLIRTAGIYALSAVVFAYYMGQEFNEGTLNYGELKTDSDAGDSDE